MSRGGFNANARAEERESGPVNIGAAVYHPARLTNAKLHEVRKLARKGGIEARRASRQSQEYADALELAKEDGMDEAEAKELAQDAGDSADEVTKINNESIAHQLSILLVDENMQPVSVERMLEAIRSDIDARDVNGLMGYLLGPDEDPTKTTATETTTTG